MTRDCLKYGVVFIFSTNGPNTVRYRLRQNFKQNVVLQFNDPMDYASVIPGVRKKEPSKAFGRGLILLDSIFEFQTAYSYAEEKMTDYIKIVCDKLNKICEYKAQRIPILPDTVTQEFISSYLGSLSNIPVGVEKETLDVATLNIKDKFMFNITGEDISAEPAFIKGFINNILSVPNAECIIFDTNSILNEINHERVFYSKDTCYASIDKLTEEATNNNQEKTVICFLININAMLGKLSAIEKGKFTTLINDSKKNGNIKYIIVDTIDVIKSINFEPWYKSNVDMSEGIWLGNGIGNQFTLKVTTNSRVLRAEVAPSFGYVIKKGKASLIKLMSDE
jgi:S-DNA-T family DNA segregation ATPase FtsK/SpoIIIE